MSWWHFIRVGRRGSHGTSQAMHARRQMSQKSQKAKHYALLNVIQDRVLVIQDRVCGRWYQIVFKRKPSQEKVSNILHTCELVCLRI